MMETLSRRANMTMRVPAELLCRSVPAQNWQLATPQSTLRIGGMSPYRPTRKEFLIGTGSLLVLAPYGCGGESGAGRKTTSNGTRIIEHELGEARVPARPQRIVVVDPYASLQTTLAVDAPVVGSPTFPAEPFPDFLSDNKTEDVESLGYQELNLEKIATLEPDLICGWAAWIEGLDIYDELSKIAPTVAVASTFDWKENSRNVADVLNEREELEALISDYEVRVARFRDERDERAEDSVVSVVRFRDQGLSAFTNQNYSGRILQEAGLRMPPALTVDDPENNGIEVSLERLSVIDADIIFNMASAGGAEDEESGREVRERFQSNPLWQRLRAVKNDRVYPVDPDAWFITGGPQGANVVMNDLERYMLGEKQ